ncbi:hypothetical protein RhiirA1_483679 [Rhizophagus irregularis]|uniref:Uncharacterized protein n=1 Tax=Rhizophagus irregularis TaxID=588596 RepID=A0A2N0QK90_9GLOM|nr:hypothetical protein RhiirA1_483679 [Rhizophagus irregularis]
MSYFGRPSKYIIDQLLLQVTLHKVKALSDNLYTDIADQLAKVGCSNNSPLSISPTGIPPQLSHISFNNEIIIDRDIRKTLKKILIFALWRTTYHISNLLLINLIDWDFTRDVKWLN